MKEQPQGKTFAVIVAGVLPENADPETFAEYAINSVSTTLGFGRVKPTVGVGVYTDANANALVARLVATPLVTGV